MSLLALTQQSRLQWHRLSQRVARFGVISKINTSRPVVALTFDDGPDSHYTDKVLDILLRYRARATFFMLGRAAAAYPDLIRKVYCAGHCIGNHSWDHSIMTRLKRSERCKQIRSCEHALAPYGGRLLRAPFGDVNISTLMDGWRLGYSLIGWTADPGDWWQEDPGKLAADIMAAVVPGAILLLHDAIVDAADSTKDTISVQHIAHPGREIMLEALDWSLKKYAGNYSFITIPELLSIAEG